MRGGQGAEAMLSDGEAVEAEEPEAEAEPDSAGDAGQRSVRGAMGRDMLADAEAGAGDGGQPAELQGWMRPAARRSRVEPRAGRRGRWWWCGADGRGCVPPGGRRRRIQGAQGGHRRRAPGHRCHVSGRVG